MSKWRTFWHWLSADEGWKSLAGLTYISICVFDFIVIPAWIGLNRIDILLVFETVNFSTVEPAVQIALMETLMHQHSPITLQGAGVFHISFGAILTGSAIAHRNLTK